MAGSAQLCQTSSECKSLRVVRLHGHGEVAEPHDVRRSAHVVVLQLQAALGTAATKATGAQRSHARPIGGDAAALSEVFQRRLATQWVTSREARDPAAVVSWLGAGQAQDYLGGLWAIGLRAKGVREEDVEASIRDRTIVRTWPMRGTLHFVAGADARWMTELLAPKRGLRRRVGCGGGSATIERCSRARGARSPPRRRTLLLDATCRLPGPRARRGLHHRAARHPHPVVPRPGVLPVSARERESSTPSCCSRNGYPGHGGCRATRRSPRSRSGTSAATDPPRSGTWRAGRGCPRRTRDAVTHAGNGSRE